MKSRYILDENVVIYAQRGLNEYDQPNLDCSYLLDRIADDDGHTLVVDDVLWGKYDDQLYNPAHFHTERGPLVRIRLWELMRRIGKIDGLGHTAPPFPEEDDIPQGSQDDKFIVRLAVEETGRGTALVTTDRPLREDLSSCGIQARYGNCSDFVGSERSPKRRNWQSSYERPLPLNGYSERSPQL